MKSQLSPLSVSAAFWGTRAVGPCHSFFWEVTHRAKWGVGQRRLEKHYQQLLWDGLLTIPMAIWYYSSQPPFDQVWNKSSFPKLGLWCGNTESFVDIYLRGNTVQGSMKSLHPSCGLSSSLMNEGGMGQSFGSFYHSFQPALNYTDITLCQCPSV